MPSPTSRHLGLNKTPKILNRSWSATDAIFPDGRSLNLRLFRLGHHSTQTKMEDGRWKMEDGRWKMEDGRWKMEDRTPPIPQLCSVSP